MIQISGAATAHAEVSTSHTGKSTELFRDVAYIGQKIGEGSQKDIFHSDNAQYCLCLFRPGTTGNTSPEDCAKNEMSVSQRLKELGFPVLSVRGLVKYNELFGVEKYYIHSALDSEDLINNKRVLPSDINFNKCILADCDTIITQLKSHSIHIEDLQFLIDINGNVLINDPRDITHTSPAKSIDKVKELRARALENLLDIDSD
ncbi:T3SS effector protein kinase HopBF1 [Pseudomonas sp. MWU13-3659]|uniref:T3SS effector protein kinase HopBF1 n=1 Tax=Pseudomonas sp. MWU13-3659 TaxID=2986964 RepID=UPI0020762F9A|nr:T3SS effector protein kinase HopBF1 [Pseudomonas sp. MWU13-3659]